MKQGRRRLGTISIGLALALSACHKHGGAGANGNMPQLASLMSPKPPLYGVSTASNYYRALSVATGIDPSTDGAVSARFSTVQNNLSAFGGMVTSGTQLQAQMDLAAQFAISKVGADLNKPLSDPTRLIPFDLSIGFTSATGADTFTAPVQTSLARALVLGLTGIDATRDQTAALVKTMQTLRPLMTDDAAGKQLLVEMMITIVLLGEHSWHG